MNLELQFKLKQNPIYIKYLREHSYWYKILMRDASNFKEFENTLKEEYKLRPQDKIENIFNTIDLVSNLLKNMI